ncbi:hypothetical protein KFK09_011803 [Dendrobium nobile]|uniref:Uncharacterized protein n=1 Tax=Dendrobium nobile TaxID=94219 RepID=A0A8T3BJ89_DENNO|nr:hypothetical protein KFK09_011803 [Dendrobium nobile]
MTKVGRIYVKSKTNKDAKKMRERVNESERRKEGDDLPNQTLPTKTKKISNGGVTIAPLQTPKKIQSFHSIIAEMVEKTQLSLLAAKMTFRILYRSDSQWRERKTGKETSLSFSTSPPLFLRYLLFPLPFSLLSLLFYIFMTSLQGGSHPIRNFPSFLL